MSVQLDSQKSAAQKASRQAADAVNEMERMHADTAAASQVQSALQSEVESLRTTLDETEEELAQVIS